MKNYDSDKSEGRFEDEGFGNWPTSWWQQFFVLLRRDVKERKHESFSTLMIFHVIVIAFVTGLLWYKSDTSHLQDQVTILNNNNNNNNNSNKKRKKKIAIKFSF